MRSLPLLSALAAGALVIQPALAHAIERQFQLIGHVGFATSSGTRGGHGLAVDAMATYGLNDAFNLYATLGYTLALPDAVEHTPRHGAMLAVGALYTFDYFQVVPYLGLGARADLFVAPLDGWITPAAEARLGVSWLVSRSFALDLQISYAFTFFRREWAGDLFAVTFGAAWQREL